MGPRDQTNPLPLHRSAWPFIGGSTLMTVLLALLWAPLFFAGLAMTIGIALFFRNPRRQPPDDPDSVLAVADGRIVDIEEIDLSCEMGVNAGRMVRIGAYLSLLDVHTNRTPAPGVITFVRRRPGATFHAKSKAAQSRNRRVDIAMVTRHGETVCFSQIAGMTARQIVCDLRVGDVVDSAQCFGIIRFGSRVELFVPASCRLDIKVGDRVKGGCSVIARFSQRPAA